jgi:hypothetical protein
MIYNARKLDSFVKENNETGSYLQMDEIMKKLFTLKNKIPIIDFLNAAYGDNINYDADISYSNTEIINTERITSSYITFNSDMFISVVDGNNVFEYAIEFQTLFDKEILVRMFRYSFERAVKLEDYRDRNKIKLRFPEPYLILLEESKNVNDKLILEIEIPKAKSIKFKVKVLKYWNYDLKKLYEENMYLLYPLQIIKLRKDMERIKNSKGTESYINNRISLLNKRLIEVVRESLEAIDKAYKDGKIDINDYDEMTIIIENLNSYLINKYNIKSNVEKEISVMVKSFYDPEVEARGMEKGIAKGIEKGIEKVAANMLLHGEKEENVKKYTGLSDEQIEKIKEYIKSQGTH